MKRMILAPAIFLSALVGLLIAQEAETPKITPTRLADGLFMLEGAGGNSVACVGPDGVVLIDTGFAPMDEPLRTAVAELSNKPVRIVVNTHWHLDHVGGNQALATSKAVVAAHENVRRHMLTDQHLAIIDREVPASPAEALPMVTYQDQLTLHWGGEEISLIHLPAGHSDGDTVVWFRSTKVIHAGDLFFNCGYPFIDISHGGTIDGMIAAIEKLLDLADSSTRIVPGHGPLAKVGDLETYLTMLKDFRRAIAKDVANGKDLKDILEAPPTVDLDAKWGKVFFSPEQFTEIVFRTLPSK